MPPVEDRVQYLIRQTNEDIRRARTNADKAEAAMACGDQVMGADGRPYFEFAAHTYATLALLELVDELRNRDTL